MPRVKIKATNPKDPRQKNILLEILARHDIFITKLIPLSDGFAVIISNDQELDKIFKTSTTEDLEKNNLHPLIPPELKARRSIIIPGVDNHIYNNPEEDIQAEIEDKNSWATGQIETIFKFPNSHTLKITFKQTANAKKAQDDGIRAFQMSVPHHKIKQEIFYNINTCFKCYKMEDHNTNQCPQDKNFKVCSECSGLGHTWKECNNQNKKCLNCNGDHRTLAAKCPKRKEIIKNKRQNTQQNTQTYSQATQQNNQITLPSLPQNTGDTFARIFTCIIHAHTQNIAVPGTYETELNNMLKNNNLPTIKAPANPPSIKLFANMTSTNANNQNTNSSTNTNASTNKNTNITSATSAMEDEETINIDDNTTDTDTDTDTKISAKDIGITIYTSESTGWPKQTISKTDLIEALEKRKYKLIYTNKSYTYFQIIQLIMDEKIVLTKCWEKIDDTLFKKIRYGSNIDRTPPPRIEKQRKNSL